MPVRKKNINFELLFSATRKPGELNFKFVITLFSQQNLINIISEVSRTLAGTLQNFCQMIKHLEFSSFLPSLFWQTFSSLMIQPELLIALWNAYK